MAKKYTIKVDKDVPVPRQRENRSKWGATLRHMKVGESFKVPDASVLSLRTAIKHHIKTHAKAKEWLVRRDNNGDYRCWRTK